MTGLPLTVISGYLGAGKTTLINRLLAEEHGLRLMVLVNDFGAINIDEALLASASDDTIALTNGCVCCTMGADLFMTLGDILDRPERPDHIVVEASGIADPAAIANAAIAEPDLSYAGIVTVVDALNIGPLLADEAIAPQVLQQITAADLPLVSKATLTPQVKDQLRTTGARTPVPLPEGPVAELLFGFTPAPRGRATVAHGAYVSWQTDQARCADRATLEAKLRQRPEGLYRCKGFVATSEGMFELHIVGRFAEIRAVAAEVPPIVVGIGLAGRVTVDAIATWWQGSP